MSGIEWIDAVGDVPAATARAKYIGRLCDTHVSDKYVRRVGRHMGRIGLMPAPFGALEQWPRGPVCVAGARGDRAALLADTDGARTAGFNLKDTPDGPRWVCQRHGNVSVITQRASERVALATGGSPFDDSGDAERCRCISPLVSSGVW